MKYQDYYKILGVPRDASQDDIKKAYRRLARKYHPDVSKEKDAESRFKDIGQAYEVLKDPEKRAAYDDLGPHQAGQDFRPPPGWRRQHAQGQTFSEGFGGVDLGDLFSDLFGMGGARGAHGGGGAGRGFRQQAGQDFELDVEISLTEAYYGAERNLQVEVPEPEARGRTQRVPKTIKLRIPKGATSGQKLRVRGKGGRGIGGGPAGDLHITIKLAAHPYFTPDGHDLYIDVPLAPWEAALGCDIEVPTMESRVRLHVRGGARVGQRLRLTGKGLPKPGGGQGDLYTTLQITTPPKLSQEQRKLFEQLAAASNYNPRANLWSRAA